MRGGKSLTVVCFNGLLGVLNDISSLLLLHGSLLRSPLLEILQDFDESENQSADWLSGQVNRKVFIAFNTNKPAIEICK